MENLNVKQLTLTDIQDLEDKGELELVDSLLTQIDDAVELELSTSEELLSEIVFEGSEDVWVIPNRLANTINEKTNFMEWMVNLPIFDQSLIHALSFDYDDIDDAFVKSMNEE